MKQRTDSTTPALQEPKKCLLVNLSQRFHGLSPSNEQISQAAPENRNRESKGSINKTQLAMQPSFVSTKVHRSAALAPTTKLIS